MMLENDVIRLRAPELKDVNDFYELENDSKYWSQSSTISPYSRYALKNYIMSSHDFYAERQLRFVIELKQESKAIGLIDLYDFAPHHKRAAVAVIIKDEFQNKGFAGRSLSLLCEYSFSFLKIHQLYAHIPVTNEPSKRLFLHAGFKEKGLLNEWQQTVNGYVDVLIVSLVAGLSDN